MHETHTTAVPAAAELRLRFKAICAATENKFQNYQIRVHRALSRWDRAAELDADKMNDDPSYSSNSATTKASSGG